jgi:ubiquinone/menaquinone biosynthesis C-methylase UbiE
MRMGAIPTTALEWVAARLNLVPMPAIEAVFGMLHSRALMAGVRLGLFAALDGCHASADELASRQGLQLRGTRLLCDALVAGRYLRRDSDGCYALSRSARRYLAPTSPQYLGHFIEYNYDQWAWISGLEDAVRTGQTLDLHRALDTAGAAKVPGSWTRYMEGLADLARGAASEIASKVPMPACTPGVSRTLIDVGGGHGTFSVALCRRYPDLTADILDLPECVVAGEPIARRYAGPAIADRIRYHGGDALQGPLGPDDTYDVALVFELLHHLPTGEIPSLLSRVLAVLRPGGWIALVDLLEPAHGQSPDAAAAYAALYFYLTSSGQGYTPEQVREWLHTIGYTSIRAIPLLHLPGQPMIVGQRPA